MKPNKKSEIYFVIVFFVLSGLGLILALVSAILFLKGKDGAGAVGVVSTIFSIVLSAISLTYTYFSGVETLKTISELKQQNDTLVDEITEERSKSNYNENNTESAFK